MVNYSNGKIYKIQKIGGDSDIYIGSTTKQYLSQRLDTHRGHYKAYQANKRGLTTSFNIFDKYGIENCEIVLLEACECKSKDELLKRERHYIENNKCVNKLLPGRTKKEYRESTQCDSIYYQKNRERIKERVKQYADNNKEKIKEANKCYREKNNEKIKAHKSQKCECICGGHYIHCHKARHLRTKKHQDYINSKP